MVKDCELTGYIQRKLIKTEEDIKMEYDGTVRNANDKLIQCVYGDNGINTEKQMMQKINLMRANNATIRKDYIYSKEELASLRQQGVDEHYTSSFNEKLYRRLVKMRDIMRVVQLHTNITTEEFTESFMMPVDLQQFTINVRNRENREIGDIVDPYYVYTKIREMYNGEYSRIIEFAEDSTVKKEDDDTVKFLLKLYLYDYLCPKRCTHEYKFSRIEFDEIVGYFNQTILLAKVPGGEMVGFVGAQSIGEPVTQSNLKDFHKAGTGKTTSLGLPRIRELLSITKNIKTPQLEIVLEDQYSDNEVVAKTVASYLKFTTLRDVVDSIDICYDPNPNDPDSIMSRDGVDNIFGASQGKTGCQSDIQGMPWIIRVILSKEKLLERNITLNEIKASFCRNWQNRSEDSRGSKKEFRRVIEKITQCAIISNFDNSPIPTIHIRFDANNYDFNTLIQFQEMIINKYRIKGLTNIHESKKILQKGHQEFDDDGNINPIKKYTIITEGVNLKDVAQINGINLAKVSCNDIVAIYEMYGVEAARTAYIRELTIAIGSSGGVSNYQHIELLADTITHMGGLIAVNRHGANKLDTDPLSRSSFEQTVDQLLMAAVFAESDYNRSVSARIMTGGMINGGTAAFDLLLDHDMVKSHLASETIAPSKRLVKKSNLVTDLIKLKKTKA